jgi:hypothetical protein
MVMKNLTKNLLVSCVAMFLISYTHAKNQQSPQIINQEFCYAAAEPAEETTPEIRQVIFYYKTDEDKAKVAEQKCPEACQTAKASWNGQTGDDAATTDSRGRIYSTCMCEENQ